MSGALTVIFWTIIMPVTLLVLGLRFGWPYAYYLQDALTPVWHKFFPPHIEPPVRQTLDEMGMTLEDASEEYYDAEQLERIRKAHRQVHVNWLKVAGPVWTDDERKFLGLPKTRYATYRDKIMGDGETIRDYQGNVLRDFRSKKCQHKVNEVCYRCDR
jgi:hypothetical protein